MNKKFLLVVIKYFHVAENDSHSEKNFNLGPVSEEIIPPAVPLGEGSTDQV